MLIIAEIGQNHNGDMALAKKMIRVAKKSGADVAKFQLYDVDSIFDKNFKWYKEAREAQLDYRQAKMLKQECDKAGIEFMASVFDVDRLNWVLELGVSAIKIASRSIGNRELINAAAETGKDMIVSLGMYKGKGFPKINTKGELHFLYCISKYPTNINELNFRKVDFSKYSGFSDHTVDICASIVAMARGARIIEKHFTLDKRMHGPDHKGSMEPRELEQLAGYGRSIKQML